jgi:lysophospholipase L1-like esterase
VDVPDGSKLAVSIYLPGGSGPSSWEPGAYMTSYVSTTGDHAGALTADAFTAPITAWYYLAAVAVYNPAQIGSVVAFGDSITAGQKSTLNGNATWPDVLARRGLASEPVGHRVSILDAGVPGNQVLNSSADGTSAERRFKVDVASQPGVRAVIMLEGTNDLRLDKGPNNVGPLTAVELIQGMNNIISQAHADGLRIIGGTIMPFAGDTGYYNSHSAAVREQVNHWILTSGSFDGVVNFAAAAADPSNPQKINPAYGNPVHPTMPATRQWPANRVGLNLLCP